MSVLSMGTGRYEWYSELNLHLQERICQIVLLHPLEQPEREGAQLQDANAEPLLCTLGGMIDFETLGK